MAGSGRSQRRIGAAGLLAVVLLGTTGCSGSSGDEGTRSASTEKTTSTTVPVAMARDFSTAGAVVIAHRGASIAAPEHTFAAYDIALDRGADYIEQDVQLTKDGKLVVLHDPSLERTVRGPTEQCTGLVSEHTVEELSACEAGSWFNEAHPELAEDEYAEQTIPTLQQVFDRYLTDARYYIEVKAPDDQPEMVPTLLDLIAKAEVAWADLDLDLRLADPKLPRFVIQSFSADSLRAVHEERPDLPLVQLIRNGEPVPDDDALDTIAHYAVAIGPPKTMVTKELVAAANDRCLDVHPYTVDDPSEMATLLDAGAGGIFSDDPVALRKVVEERPDGDELCAARATAS